MPWHDEARAYQRTYKVVTCDTKEVAEAAENSNEDGDSVYEGCRVDDPSKVVYPVRITLPGC